MSIKISLDQLTLPIKAGFCLFAIRSNSSEEKRRVGREVDEKMKV